MTVNDIAVESENRPQKFHLDYFIFMSAMSSTIDHDTKAALCSSKYIKCYINIIIREGDVYANLSIEDTTRLIAFYRWIVHCSNMETLEALITCTELSSE